MKLADQVAALVGAERVDELSGGHQSHVFRAGRDHDQSPIVVKVVDASLVDRDDVEARMAMVAELAVSEPMVCRPILIGGSLVTKIEDATGWVGLASGIEHAEGRQPDVGRPADAELMGRSLARLHHALARLRATALPRAAALRAVHAAPGPTDQLLHGDFNATNLRLTDSGVKVFDFDDCGYGPPLFDVVNSLYMVLFDDFSGDGENQFEPFAEAFLSGYERTSGVEVDHAELDAFIELRVAALERWLDDPAQAPIGIRTATTQWRSTLRQFVDFRRS